MKSRLLNRLDNDIRGAIDPVAAGCLRCERAGYLARLGQIDEAEREIAAVQLHHQAQRSAALSAWLNLAEGLLLHYRDLGSRAQDKLMRAQAMSSASGLRSLQALSAAWLAHLAYLRMDAAALAAHAADALELAAPGHHAARARATLVIAQAYHEGGRFDLARPWYDSARHHASTDGDDATLSAMMWNMASLRVAALRQTLVCGDENAAPDPHALLSAESTAHFDAMLGVRSLSALQPILRAQICTLLGRIDEALTLYEAHLAEAVAQGMREVEGTLLADRAWCRLQRGHTQGAAQDAAAAQACLECEGSFCDRAPGHSRLAQVAQALGDHATAERQRELAAHAWQGHAQDQARFLDALNRRFAGLRPQGDPQPH